MLPATSPPDPQGPGRMGTSGSGSGQLSSGKLGATRLARRLRTAGSRQRPPGPSGSRAWRGADLVEPGGRGGFPRPEASADGRRPREGLQESSSSHELAAPPGPALPPPRGRGRAGPGPAAPHLPRRGPQLARPRTRNPPPEPGAPPGPGPLPGPARQALRGRRCPPPASTGARRPHSPLRHGPLNRAARSARERGRM